MYLAEQECLFTQAGADVEVTQYQEGTGGLGAIPAKTGQFTASTRGEPARPRHPQRHQGAGVFFQSPSFIRLVARAGINGRRPDQEVRRRSPVLKWPAPPPSSADSPWSVSHSADRYPGQLSGELRQHARLVDDIDDGEAAETVAFSLDGKTYEIDLREHLETALPVSGSGEPS